MCSLSFCRRPKDQQDFIKIFKKIVVHDKIIQDIGYTNNTSVVNYSG